MKTIQTEKSENVKCLHNNSALSPRMQCFCWYLSHCQLCPRWHLTGSKSPRWLEMWKWEGEWERFEEILTSLKDYYQARELAEEGDILVLTSGSVISQSQRAVVRENPSQSPAEYSWTIIPSSLLKFTSDGEERRSQAPLQSHCPNPRSPVLHHKQPCQAFYVSCPAGNRSPPRFWSAWCQKRLQDVLFGVLPSTLFQTRYARGWAVAPGGFSSHVIPPGLIPSVSKAWWRKLPNHRTWVGSAIQS